ncbi:MAG: gliding motility-associated C-terminal domain-containing protein [Prevotellaceae bacterium]|jgi:gliding motility-associated-like protein|nr:gliding motility-associated C-terminal domain-containing protein [Prevotellaceae bacterium]
MNRIIYWIGIFTYGIFLAFFFLTGNKANAQECSNARLEYEIIGNKCDNGGKASIKIKVVTDAGTDNIDLSNNRFTVADVNGVIVPLFSPKGSDVINDVPPGKYNISTSFNEINDIKCNGTKLQDLGIQKLEKTNITVSLDFMITKAEYFRCSGSDINVSTAISGGKGPYKFEIFSDGNSVFNQEMNTTSFTASVGSGNNLTLTVTDKGCAQNQPETVTLTKKADYSSLKAISGDTEVCTGGTIQLQVKSDAPAATNYVWKKDGQILASTSSLTINNAQNSNSGVYEFSMKIDGCSNTHTESITVTVGAAAKPIIKPALPCLNSAPVTVDQYVDKTSDAYTLIWYGADQNTLIGTAPPTFNPDIPDKTATYYVSQKNTGNCESDKVRLDITVSKSPQPIDANKVILCNDMNSSDPRMTIVGAGNGYTYNLYDAFSGGNNIGSGISSNDTARITTGQALTVGNSYYIETINQNGCASTSRTPVSVSLQSSLISGANRICFGATLSLSSSYPGGKITWTRPDNTTYTGTNLVINNADHNTGGIYKIVIDEPGLGCTMRDQVTVAVTQPDAPVPTKTSYRYAENEQASPMTATAGQGNTLKWYSPDGTLMNVQSPVPATSQTGIFVYKVSQDSSGCESPKVDVTVTIGAIPPPVSPSDVKVCVAEKPVLQISNTSSLYEYVVYNAGTEIARGAGNDASISLTCNAAITENTALDIEVVDAYGVKSGKTSINVISINRLINSQASASAICVGSSGNLEAVNLSGAAYKWTSPSGTEVDGQKMTVSNAAKTDEGNYKLTVTVQGCQPAETQTYLRITQPLPPVPAQTVYQYAENEQASPMTATAGQGNTLKWYSPDGTLMNVQSPVPATSQTGVFIYKVSQDSAGCESPKVDVTVTVGAIPPSVPSADINVCIAEKPTVNINNTDSKYLYVVYDGKGNEIASGKGNGATLSLTSDASISENAELEIYVRDEDFSINSIKTTKPYVSINNLIDMQHTSTTVCEGSKATMTATTIEGASYTWKFKGNPIAGSQSVEILGEHSNEGEYTLDVLTAGCPVATSPQPVDLRIAKPDKPAAKTDIYQCKDAVASPLAATALSGYKLVWFDAADAQLQEAPVPDTSIADTVEYFVMQVSITDEKCFSDKEKITVYIEDTPRMPDLSIRNICANDDSNETSVSIPDAVDGYKYSLYDFPSGGNLIGETVGNGNSTEIVLSEKITYDVTYYLQIESIAGCMSERMSLQLHVVNITVAPDVLPPYEIGTLYTQTLISNISNPTFSIIEGFLPTGITLSNGVISGFGSSSSEDPGKFTVEVSNGQGCSIYKEYTLKCSDLTTPKKFSPNGDGINDIFMKGYKLIVFDRHGRQIYEGEDGWDVTRYGKEMPEDVYYFLIYYTDKDGNQKKRSGYTTLIKNL